MSKIVVLQICHSYEMPFEVVADFYAALFPSDKYQLTTVFLKGEKKGFLPKNIDDIQRCLNLPNLKIVGLMTIGPNTKNINKS